MPAIFSMKSNDRIFYPGRKRRGLLALLAVTVGLLAFCCWGAVTQPPASRHRLGSHGKRRSLLHEPSPTKAPARTDGDVEASKIISLAAARPASDEASAALTLAGTRTTSPPQSRTSSVFEASDGRSPPAADVPIAMSDREPVSREFVASSGHDTTQQPSKASSLAAEPRSKMLPVEESSAVGTKTSRGQSTGLEATHVAGGDEQASEATSPARGTPQVLAHHASHVAAQGGRNRSAEEFNLPGFPGSADVALRVPSAANTPSPPGKERQPSQDADQSSEGSRATSTSHPASHKRSNARQDGRAVNEEAEAAANQGSKAAALALSDFPGTTEGQEMSLQESKHVGAEGAQPAAARNATTAQSTKQASSAPATQSTKIASLEESNLPGAPSLQEPSRFEAQAAATGRQDAKVASLEGSDVPGAQGVSTQPPPAAPAGEATKAASLEGLDLPGAQGASARLRPLTDRSTMPASLAASAIPVAHGVNTEMLAAPVTQDTKVASLEESDFPGAPAAVAQLQPLSSIPSNASSKAASLEESDSPGAQGASSVAANETSVATSLNPPDLGASDPKQLALQESGLPGVHVATSQPPKTSSIPIDQRPDTASLQASNLSGTHGNKRLSLEDRIMVFLQQPSSTNTGNLGGQSELLGVFGTDGSTGVVKNDVELGKSSVHDRGDSQAVDSGTWEVLPVRGSSGGDVGSAIAVPI